MKRVVWGFGVQLVFVVWAFFVCLYCWLGTDRKCLEGCEDLGIFGGVSRRSQEEG